MSINYTASAGRLGNQLLNYGTVRLVARKFQRNIIHKHKWLFKAPECFDPLVGDRSYVKTITIKPTNIDDILNMAPEELSDTGIMMGSAGIYLQTKSLALYLRRHLYDIVNDELKGPPKDGIFIHYRLGDIYHASMNRVAKIEYIERAIEGIEDRDNIPKYIASDSPHDELVKHICNKYGFRLYNKKIYGGSRVPCGEIAIPDCDYVTACDTIKFGSTFRNKILSHGTFSWWIGVLGSQHNVFFPHRDEYDKWHGDIFCFNDWRELSSESPKCWTTYGQGGFFIQGKEFRWGPDKKR